MTPWTLIVGMALVDFVWEGTLIALAAALLLWALRRRAPRVRYAVACAALAVMLAAPVAAVLSVSGTPADPVIAASYDVAAPPLRTATALDRVVHVTGANAANSGAWQSAPRVLTMVVLLWLAGVIVLLGRLSVGWIRIRRLHGDSLRMAPSRWTGVGTTLAARLHLSAAIRFIDAVSVDTPVVIGWLRPVVLLPVAALASLTPAQVEAILAHELAHVRRHDFVVNMLQAVAETLLFYHPAVWWLSSRIRVEREQCCDDVAVEMCGDAVTYAEALVHLASWSTAPALSVGATAGPLLDRVRRVLRLEPRPVRGSAAFGLAALLAVAAVFVAGFRTPALARGAADSDAVWMARLAELHRIVPDFHGHSLPGPMDVNRIMHFNLFPERVPFPADDPLDARAWGVTVTYPGGEQMVKGFTARSLVRYAYGLDGNTVIDVPVWMDTESVSLNAHAVSANPDTEDVLFAIRTALDTQMHVRLRREVRDYPVYALVLANADGRLGPGMHPATPGECVTGDMLRGSPGSAARLIQGQRMPICGVDNSLTGPVAQGATIDELAEAIQRPWLDRPVVDRTGLKGRFDARLQLGLVPLSVIASVHPDSRPVLASIGSRSMQDALPEQLGLTLEDETAPYDVVIVDGATPPRSR